jgi:hypothetical protein
MVRRRFFSAVSNHELAAILRDAAKTPLLKDVEVAPSW